MHLSDSQPGHWQPLQCHDGKSLLQHLRPTPMPFWASGDWHDDDYYYYYYISFYDMLLLICYHYLLLLLLYYYYLLLLLYNIISIFSLLLLLLILWWWWWFISNNLDSNMETMGWQICHPWFTIKTILMLLRLQKLGINDIQISMTRQRQLKPWRGPYGRWAELPKMTVPVPMRFIAHIIPHISGVYTVTWSWKFVKSYNHTVQLYIIIPCTH